MVNIEIWKDIEGYEGLYQVSNLGRVKSLKFNKIKILSQGISGSGYKIVSLSKENQRKIFLVHRLVAMAFVVVICFHFSIFEPLETVYISCIVRHFGCDLLSF